MEALGHSSPGNGGTRPAAGARGSARGDRQLVGRRHHREDHGWHDHHLEPGCRAHVRVHRRGNHRPADHSPLPPDRVAEIQQILSKIRSGERVTYHETTRQRKDGTIFPVSLTISPVWDDRHGLVGASSIARDISERYRIQAELRLRTDDLESAYRDLETFSYSVSHDLRAPLRALDGLSHALLADCGDSLSEAGLGYTKRIRAAGQQMTSLIEDLLNLARVSRAEIRPQVTDLGAEAARIAQELQHQEPDRHVRFAIQQPAWATAD